MASNFSGIFDVFYGISLNKVIAKYQL